MKETDLGTDRNGFSYRRRQDAHDYVYQYDPKGGEVGWMCSYTAWERTLHKIIESNNDNEVDKLISEENLFL